MVRARKPDTKEIEQYDHKDKKRCNNPPVGLVTPETDKDGKAKTYQYDPHLDPQLIWAGKAEHTSFEVPVVSLHVHERIDPKTIIKAVQRRSQGSRQVSLFELSGENPPIRSAIDFYKHRHNWSNRLIAGDSLLVMNSLLEKEGMAGLVQTIYIDPPYGIRYGSNFQPFVNKRDVKDGKDEDLTQEPEMIKAFRDTWELGIHSYLAYLRDRLLLAKEMLSESGSIFVQIGEENVHKVRSILDEVFGENNFVSQISVFKTTTPRELLDNNLYYILWYAKDTCSVKYRQVFLEKMLKEWTSETKGGSWGVTMADSDRPLTPEEKTDPTTLSKGSRVYQLTDLFSAGTAKQSNAFKFQGEVYLPRTNTHWKTTKDGLVGLANAKRIEVRGGRPWFKRYHDDWPMRRLTNVWSDTSGKASERLYVVQTQDKVIERCILMTTDPGDLVLDPTCGSGTTAYVAEQWGRRWITCDTSRIAITIAKQRLMTALFDYYDLARPEEGISSGFKYKTVPHFTLKSIANNPEIVEGMSQREIAAAIKKYADQETLYDQPSIDKSKVRVTGPFTVEAVPAPSVKPLMEMESDQPADASVSRSGETLRQAEWRDEILKTGIRARSGEKILFSRVETLQGTHWLHAEAETKEDNPQKAVISFGPEHAPLEQRQVALAIEESLNLVPKPKVIIFAAFEFDPEAAKDIDETNWPGITLIKVKMSEDLLTEDEDLIEAYHGRVSLPFEPGTHERIAVKIVDDRGIESLKLMDMRS